MSSTTANLPSVSRDEFRRACAKFATGIAVVTVRAADGSPHGLTVNSFASVSAEPPLILVCIDLRCNLLPHFQASESFAVNVLSEDQRAISSRFAELPDARFEGIEWRTGRTVSPVLEGVIAAIECRVVNRMEAGDHAVLIGKVVAADLRDGRPLLYFGSQYDRLAL